MRRFAYLLALAIAACNLPLGQSTSDSTSTGDAGPQCPQTSGCASCTQCALGGPCAELYSTCQSDPDCAAIDGCAASCNNDPTCLQNCAAQNPNGQSAYEAVLGCVDCQQCPTACAGYCMQ
jgi:hypothetical protein